MPSITVFETHEFISSTRKLMDDGEREELEKYLACNPKAADVIPGTGGLPGRNEPQAEVSIMSKVGESIVRGLEQSIVFAEGSAKKGTYAVHIPPEIDVKAIRVRLGMTQQEFAVRFGFSVNTVRHWEQGRRVPEGPTRAYLLVIDREPKAVQKALRIARSFADEHFGNSGRRRATKPRSNLSADLR